MCFGAELWAYTRRKHQSIHRSPLGRNIGVGFQDLGNSLHYVSRREYIQWGLTWVAWPEISRWENAGWLKSDENAPFSASDKLSHIWVILIDCPCVTDLITLWHLHQIGIRGSAFRPFSTRTFKTRDTPFMEKSQQRVIIYHFSLKGWGARKIQNELMDALRLDVYLQAQISQWLAPFSVGDISCLDETRPGRPLSILDHHWNISWKSPRSPVLA
jgi:hypothetical protein